MLDQGKPGDTEVVLYARAECKDPEETPREVLNEKVYGWNHNAHQKMSISQCPKLVNKFPDMVITFGIDYEGSQS